MSEIDFDKNPGLSPVPAIYSFEPNKTSRIPVGGIIIEGLGRYTDALFSRSREDSPGYWANKFDQRSRQGFSDKELVTALKWPGLPKADPALKLDSRVNAVIVRLSKMQQLTKSRLSPFYKEEFFNLTVGSAFLIKPFRGENIGGMNIEVLKRSDADNLDLSGYWDVVKETTLDL